jgi:hypothetical protein
MQQARLSVEDPPECQLDNGARWNCRSVAVGRVLPID